MRDHRIVDVTEEEKLKHLELDRDVQKQMEREWLEPACPQRRRRVYVEGLSNISCATTGWVND